MIEEHDGDNCPECGKRLGRYGAYTETVSECPYCGMRFIDGKPCGGFLEEAIEKK